MKLFMLDDTFKNYKITAEEIPSDDEFPRILIRVPIRAIQENLPILKQYWHFSIESFGSILPGIPRVCWEEIATDLLLPHAEPKWEYYVDEVTKIRIDRDKTALELVCACSDIEEGLEEELDRQKV